MRRSVQSQPWCPAAGSLKQAAGALAAAPARCSSSRTMSAPQLLAVVVVVVLMCWSGTHMCAAQLPTGDHTGGQWHTAGVAGRDAETQEQARSTSRSSTAAAEQLSTECAGSPTHRDAPLSSAGPWASLLTHGLANHSLCPPKSQSRSLPFCG